MPSGPSHQDPHVGISNKFGVPFLGVPIIRTIVYWGLYWGTLILGNYHVVLWELGKSRNRWSTCYLSGRGENLCGPDRGVSKKFDLKFPQKVT